MASKAKGKIPSPLHINDDLWGAWRTFTLTAAMQLDVFTLIAQGRHTAADVADGAGANAGAMRRLLDALVALKYLRRKGDKYALEPIAATYLVRGGELFLEGAAAFAGGLANDWMHLAEVVRTGRPTMPSAPEDRLMDFMPTLVKSIFPTSHVPARAAVAALGAPARKRINNILDVAAGSGAWSLAFAQALPKARVTVVDLPPITAITREYATRYGVADRYDYLEGNLREVEFGRERFDLVILGHIIHSEGAEWGRRLIEKSAVALREKGMLLIAELIPNDERTGPLMPVLFGLNMLIHTAEGDVFTMRDYRGWLKEVGFKSIKTIRNPGPSPLILATK
jgi:precorrin-6B methylase 2